MEDHERRLREEQEQMRTTKTGAGDGGRQSGDNGSVYVATVIMMTFRVCLNQGCCKCKWNYERYCNKLRSSLKYKFEISQSHILKRERERERELKMIESRFLRSQSPTYRSFIGDFSNFPNIRLQ